jgi:hypothetical protein
MNYSPPRYRLLESHSAGLKSEMQEEAAAAAERLRKCKEEHTQQTQLIKEECDAKLELLNEEHRKNLEETRRKYR